MGHGKRTFLLGAGFSKAVAGGPTMQELWPWMVNRYKIEKERRTSVDNLRIDWFESLDSNLNRLESISNTEYKNYKDIQVKLRDNLEYVFTLIDLSLTAPELYIENSSFKYPAIPIPFSEDDLVGMKKNLQTYLYLILVDLKARILVDQFANVIRMNDDFITFNYDLVLEKLLWTARTWSPLKGYIGVTKFKKDKDKIKLIEANLFSQLKIHKMHGSLNWGEPGVIERVVHGESLMIEMDDIEHKTFYLDDMGKILNRRADTIDQGKEDQVFVGRHNPGWVLPSFIKPFDRIEFFQIWQSAMKVISKSKELVIVGYSFRPEDSNAFLLISMLPSNCKVILVDSQYEKIRERLERKGVRIHKTFESLEKYLDSQ